MHDALFANQAEWAGATDPLPHFREYARRIEIDPARLARWVESGETSETIRRNLEFARTLGVRSTPTVVIGDRGFAGSRPWPEVRLLIEQTLSAAADSSAASEPGVGRSGAPDTSG